MPLTVGVDLGATKVRATIFKNKTPLKTHKILHHNKDVLTCMCRCIDNVLSSVVSKKVSCIGLAVPGVVYDNKVKTSPNAKSILNYDFATRIERRYKLRTVLINDADAFVLGCKKLYFPRKKKLTIAAMTFGTGVGIGVLANGQLLKNAGELGQFYLSTIKTKKLEQYANGKAYQNSTLATYAKGVSDMIELVHRAYLPQTIFLGGSLIYLPKVLPTAKKNLAKKYDEPQKFTLTKVTHDAITLGAVVAAQKKRLTK